MQLTEFKEIKKLREIQKLFINETGLSSWEEAEEKFPLYTDPDSLDQFKCNISIVISKTLTFTLLGL